LLARAEHPRRGVLKTCRDDRRLDIKEETMRKTMITMATVALASGLFAGIAVAGERGGGNQEIENNQVSCPINDPSPLVDLSGLGGGIAGQFAPQTGAPMANCRGH
jgi:hypothetical protein